MRLYAKKYNNKKSRFARASARFSALALNGNALNCNEKLNVSVDSCSTLASLVPLLALSTPVGFGLRPIVPLTKQYSIVLFGRVSLSLSFATAPPTPRRRVHCFTPVHAKKIRLPCLC